ncbi:hypothetical protein D3C85_1142450 [compost metagenome]
MNVLFALNSWLTNRKQLRDVKGAIQAVILRHRAEATDFFAHVWLMEQWRKIDAFGFPMRDRLLGLEDICASNHLFNRAEAKLCHHFADIVRDEGHEVHNMLRIPSKFLAKLRILRSDPNRTSIQVADAHHHAADRNERCRCEAKLLGTEQGSYDNVAPCHQLAVRLNGNTAAQVVQHECLMRLRQTELPRQSRVTNTRLR